MFVLKPGDHKMIQAQKAFDDERDFRNKSAMINFV
jgi:hypothetical protein